MPTMEELIGSLGKCALCDFQRQGNACVMLQITIPDDMKKNGCLKFSYHGKTVTN